jgi:hypothetical protein
VDGSRFRVSALWCVSSFCVLAIGKTPVGERRQAHTEFPGRKLLNFGERSAVVEIVEVEGVERVETVEAIDEATAKRRDADQAYCFA